MSLYEIMILAIIIVLVLLVAVPLVVSVIDSPKFDKDVLDSIKKENNKQ